MKEKTASPQGGLPSRPRSGLLLKTASKLLEGLNPEQERAVTHGDGPLLIVAGAGTGKTTVITKRIAWLIETDRARPDEILALTFTEKAAAEMEERVDQLLPIGYTEMWIQTFHGFCEKVLKERGADMGLATNFRLLNETGAWLMMRENLDAMELEYYRPMGNPSKFIHDLLGHFSRAKDELVSPEDYAAYAETLEGEEEEKERVLEIAKAFSAYQKLLTEQSALDFGSLITETVKLFKKRKGVLETFRKRFKYILVDEFQDTNYAQYALVKQLSGMKGNVTVVGDDDQSIYKFRGASVSNILGFKQDFPESEQVFLTTNYRSKQEILDLSYAFIKQNDPNRLEARLAKSDGLTKRMKAHAGKGAIVKRILAPDLQDEAMAVVEEIAALHAAEPDTSWSDFAILFRANSYAKPFLAALEDHGIPHLYVASKGLYAKPVIQDAVCYLKLLDRYHESPALYRVLSWEIFKIPTQDLIELNAVARKKSQSLWKTLLEAELSSFGPKSLERFRHVVDLINQHTERARKTQPARLLKEVFLDTGYYQELLAEENAENLEAIRHLNQFVRRIQAYEENDPYPTLGKFMQELEWELESGEEGDVPVDIDSGPDTVKLMTMHTSKGLEFRHVFLVQLVAGRFPSRKHHEPIPFPDALVKETLNEGDNVHLEEERRLFYVGATRAKHRLHLTGAEDVGGTRKKKPSVFLDELTSIEESSALVTHVKREEREAGLLTSPEKTERETNFKLTLPKSFSFSQLAAYDRCALQYKYAHLLKIPTVDKGLLSFGKAVHAVLEYFIQDYNPAKEPMVIEQLLEKYEELWMGEWYDNATDRDRHYKAGKEAIRKVHARTVEEKPQPWLQEAPFSIKVGGHILKGKIDRVDRLPNGKAVIIDYKTGRAKDPDTLQKEQLYIYQLALAQVYDAEVEEMFFWYVLHDDQRHVKVSEKNLKKIQDKLIERIGKIQSLQFPAKPGPHTCGYCDFKDICAEKKL